MLTASLVNHSCVTTTGISSSDFRNGGVDMAALVAQNSRTAQWFRPPAMQRLLPHPGKGRNLALHLTLIGLLGLQPDKAVSVSITIKTLPAPR